MYGTINPRGINEIKEFLKSHHKIGIWSESQLNAWAAEAEFQIAEGNSASIEISKFASKTGWAETFTVSVDGIDWHENEND
jgi:hypothetical protein